MAENPMEYKELFDQVTPSDFDCAHAFAVRANGDGIQLLIGCGPGAQGIATLFCLDDAQELVDALQAAITEARA